MKYYKILIYIVLVSSQCVTLKGQDSHFSQFYANPLLINPALTGTGDGRYRVSSIYRDQYRSALDNPFRTYSLTGDINFDFGGDRGFPDKIAVGLSFFGDRVNGFDFNTTSITIYGAYHKALDKATNSFLSAGLYLGVAQRNVNYEDLTFQDQFNAIDGYTLGTNEFLPNNNFGYGDLGLGINYSISPSKSTHYYAGLGIFHINSPNISFYKDEITNNPDLDQNNALDPRVTIYGGASYGTTTNWSIQPRFLIQLQDQNRTYNLGTNFRYLMDDEKWRYFHIGPWLRMVDNVDGLGIESAVLAIGFQTGSFVFGISYDQPFSDFSGNRAGLSALEFSLSFTGDFDNDEGFCPKF